ncbi:sulfate adenylyltransferase subunit 1 [Bifidobacterium adolescentis ATCC 15703]|uniref:Sulfate adenylyltransferase subunit 1 n=1 Tax=Bifidobacterium adolescentis (strain ATCC 15703 / DSM 20083 / NCTC 11814 / E194a) TaxID=367928 RepID=A1A397_BIFAA|nr:sulfate adenylyltransferase subunit 1 [Bifidobacterium adolescentis ATCC 15703]
MPSSLPSQALIPLFRHCPRYLCASSALSRAGLGPTLPVLPVSLVLCHDSKKWPKFWIVTHRFRFGGMFFEAFSLEMRRFIPPYCFWGRKNVSRFEKTAEISNRDTFIAEDSAPKLVQGSLETSLCWFVMNWSELP